MKKQDKAKMELYKQFIIHMHGKEAIDRLELEYAIQQTNELLEIRDEHEFEKKRKEYEI